MAIFDFTREQSSAIFSIDTERDDDMNQVFVRYTSNPDKEYIFTTDSESLMEIESVANSIINNNSDDSIGKTIHRMIREERLVAQVA